MKELNSIDPKSLKIGQTYFTDGLLVRFVEEQKNTRSSYFVFEPLPGQKTQRLIKLSVMRVWNSCFEAPASYFPETSQTTEKESTQLSLSLF